MFRFKHQEKERKGRKNSLFFCSLFFFFSFPLQNALHPLFPIPMLACLPAVSRRFRYAKVYIRINYGIVYTPPSHFSGVNSISSVCFLFFFFFLVYDILSLHPSTTRPHNCNQNVLPGTRQYPRHRAFHQPSRKNVTCRNNNRNNNRIEGRKDNHIGRFHRDLGRGVGIVVPYCAER